MSHFTEIAVNFLQKNEKHFIAALESQYGEGNVEVHEKAVKLDSIYGSPAKPCHIVIRRKDIKSARADVGYRRNKDGTYTAYIEDLDFSKKRENKILFEYTAKVSEAALKAKGYSYKRVAQKDGTVKIIASKYI